MTKPVTKWVREPLVQFLVIGLLILGVDRFFGQRSQAAFGDASRIVVTASQQATLAEAFRVERGRAATPDELRAVLDRWIDEQVLYREALALGLDRRDPIVQRQLTQKMRFLIEDSSVLPEPTQAELQAWLDHHSEKYGRPPTLSFEQVFLSRGGRGDKLNEDATRVMQQLKAAPEQFAGMGDPFLLGQNLANADARHLRASFGEGFAEAVTKLPVGKWSGPVSSSLGLHIVRVTGRGAFQPARLEEVAERVRVDYRLARREELNREAMARIRARYHVEFQE